MQKNIVSFPPTPDALPGVLFWESTPGKVRAEELRSKGDILYLFQSTHQLRRDPRSHYRISIHAPA